MNRRWTWRIPALVMAVLAVAGLAYVYLPYVGWSDSDADARARTEAYLRAVVGGSEDRGWSLLEQSGRNAYGSEDAYRLLMSEADWSEFTWELRYNGVCDDGACSYVLRLPNGRDSAPDVAWCDRPGDPGFLISTGDSPAAQQGEAFIGVRQRGWFGGIGIEVSGVGRSS